MRFRNVSFRYQDGSAFRVGPLDFKLQRGEVTFIVGGNGSGKSSLGKVISLHYPPLEGEVYFGRVRVDRHSVNTCRQAVSAIFADYYLFDRLLGRVSRERQSLVNQYLGELGLTGHVTIERGRFSTRALSQGQRKRLALLVMLLDDRDVYVFDEWAADQDPAFKEFFYRKVLATLKARNKVVVVITHDERYFSCADRIMVMEQGRIAATHVGESACTF